MYCYVTFTRIIRYLFFNMIYWGCNYLVPCCQTRGPGRLPSVCNRYMYFIFLLCHVGEGRYIEEGSECNVLEWIFIACTLHFLICGSVENLSCWFKSACMYFKRNPGWFSMGGSSWVILPGWFFLGGNVLRGGSPWVVMFILIGFPWVVLPGWFSLDG